MGPQSTCELILSSQRVAAKSVAGRGGSGSSGSEDCQLLSSCLASPIILAVASWFVCAILEDKSAFRCSRKPDQKPFSVGKWLLSPENHVAMWGWIPPMKWSGSSAHSAECPGIWNKLQDDHDPPAWWFSYLFVCNPQKKPMPKSIPRLVSWCFLHCAKGVPPDRPSGCAMTGVTRLKDYGYEAPPTGNWLLHAITRVAMVPIWLFDINWLSLWLWLQDGAPQICERWFKPWNNSQKPVRHIYHEFSNLFCSAAVHTSSTPGHEGLQLGSHLAAVARNGAASLASCASAADCSPGT